ARARRARLLPDQRGTVRAEGFSRPSQGSFRRQTRTPARLRRRCERGGRGPGRCASRSGRMVAPKRAASLSRKEILRFPRGMRPCCGSQRRQDLMLSGACMCGAIQYEIEGHARFMYQCHCGKCRAASGASFVTNLIVDAERFKIAAGKEKLSAYESSPG